MIQIIESSQDENVYINMFNLHYDVKPDDIYDFYDNIQFTIDPIGKGFFLAEFTSKEEAIKLIKKGSGVIFGLFLLLNVE